MSRRRRTAPVFDPRISRKEIAHYVTENYLRSLRGETMLLSDADWASITNRSRSNITKFKSYMDQALYADRRRALGTKVHVMTFSSSYAEIARIVQDNYLRSKEGKTVLLTNNDWCEVFDKKKNNMSKGLMENMDPVIHRERQLLLQRMHHEETLGQRTLEEMSEHGRRGFEQGIAKLTREELDRIKVERREKAVAGYWYEGERYRSKPEAASYYFLKMYLGCDVQHEIHIDNSIRKKKTEPKFIKIDFFVETDYGRAFFEYHDFSASSDKLSFSLFPKPGKLASFRKKLSRLNLRDSKLLTQNLTEQMMQSYKEKRQAIVNADEVYAGTPVYAFWNPEGLYDAIIHFCPAAPLPSKKRFRRDFSSFIRDKMGGRQTWRNQVE